MDVGVINDGTISADTAGGTISIRAQPFTNNGVIQSPGGTINLAGTLFTSGLGAIQSAGGIVLLTGLLENTNQNLLLNGPGDVLTLQGGTIHGGTVTGTNGGQLVFGSGTLDGVMVNGDLDLSANNAVATVLNGLVLNGTARLGNTSSGHGRLDFSGTQTLSGNGTVVFGGGFDRQCNALRVTQAGTTLTLGPGILVRGHTGSIGWNGNQCGVFGPVDVGVINDGTISADTAGGTISIRAQPFTNNGTTNELNGGRLIIQ